MIEMYQAAGWVLIACAVAIVVPGLLAMWLLLRPRRVPPPPPITGIDFIDLPPGSVRVRFGHKATRPEAIIRYTSGGPHDW